ncbi:hypothetical protein vseg_011915 [Gypsophila vaccaria]
MMLSNNNNLTCEAASAADTIDFECALSVFEIANATIDNPYGRYGAPNFVTAENGSVILNPLASIRQYCGSVPKTKLSGRDLVLCICKYQDAIESKAGGNGEENPFVKVLNALGTDKNLTKSCGIDDFDCNTAFRSVLTTCEADAREAMKTCAPMIKAAAEKDVGNRGRQHCCSTLNMKACAARYIPVKYNLNSTQIIARNKYLQSMNDTLRDKCGFSEAELLNPSACELAKNLGSSDRQMKTPNFHFLATLYKDLRFCGPDFENPRKEASNMAVEAKPLINPFTGCCLDNNDDSCNCDPRSVSCCQKMGALWKNKRDSCGCQLLNSNTTPSSTRDFLNFVRSNDIQTQSCTHISTVYTDTCAVHSSDAYKVRFVPISLDDLAASILRKGFRTFDNPDP